MSVVGKVFVVVNLILSMAFVGWAATMLGKADDWMHEHQKLVVESTAAKQAFEKRISEITAEKNELDRVKGEKEEQNRNLTDKNEDLAQRVTTLENEKSQLESSVEGIKVELGTFRENSNQAQARIAQLETENDDLRQRSNQARDDEAASRQNAARLQEELNTANETLAGLRVQITDLTAQGEDLQNTLNAIAAISPEFVAGLGSPAPKIDGQVTDVSDEYGFVQLNVGSDDQVRIGYKFDVFRGNSYLAEVVVRDVTPDSAWAKITMLPDGVSLRAGDMATTRL